MTPRSATVMASKRDPAGINIIRHLAPKLGSAKSPFDIGIAEVEEEIVNSERGPDNLSPRPEIAVFASKHRSESGRPCLTVHPPGNFGSADLGGKPGAVSTSSPRYMKAALRSIHRLAGGMDFQVVMEATHHGPFTKVPCYFIEIGSRMDQWQDQEAGEVLASSIMESLGEIREDGPVAFGLGGPHYSRRFTRLMVETDYAISHIVPRHQMKLFGSGLLKQLLAGSDPRPDLAIIEWKGMRGGERRSALACLEESGIEYRRLRDCLREV